MDSDSRLRLYQHMWCIVLLCHDPMFLMAHKLTFGPLPPPLPVPSIAPFMAQPSGKPSPEPSVVVIHGHETHNRAYLIALPIAIFVFCTILAILLRRSISNRHARAIGGFMNQIVVHTLSLAVERSITVEEAVLKLRKSPAQGGLIYMFLESVKGGVDGNLAARILATLWNSNVEYFLEVAFCFENLSIGDLPVVTAENVGGFFGTLYECQILHISAFRHLRLSNELARRHPSLLPLLKGFFKNIERLRDPVGNFSHFGSLLVLDDGQYASDEEKFQSWFELLNALDPTKIMRYQMLCLCGMSEDLANNGSSRITPSLLDITP